MPTDDDNGSRVYAGVDAFLYRRVHPGELLDLSESDQQPGKQRRQRQGVPRSLTDPVGSW